MPQSKQQFLEKVLANFIQFNTVKDITIFYAFSVRNYIIIDLKINFRINYRCRLVIE
jgi:hypothetical protein